MNVFRQDGDCRIQITDDPIFREFNLSRLVLGQLQDGDRRIVLDLALVSTLHSPGLANLVAIHVSLQKRNRTLVLTGLNAHNRRLLQVTNLDQLFTVET